MPEPRRILGSPVSCIYVGGFHWRSALFPFVGSLALTSCQLISGLGDLRNGPASGGAGTTTTSSATMVGIGGAGGVGGVGGATTHATTQVSSTASVGSTTAASGSTGTGGECSCLATSVCDCDGDGVERYDPAHGCTNVANDAAHRDCDDCDSQVFPGQTSFFPIIGPNDFDYDCSGANDPNYVEGTCASRTGLSANGGCNVSFLELAVSCGDMAMVDVCIQGVLDTSPCQVDHTLSLFLACH